MLNKPEILNPLFILHHLPRAMATLPPLPQVWLRDTHAVKQCKCEQAVKYFNRNKVSDIIIPFVGMPGALLFMIIIVLAGGHELWVKITWSLLCLMVAILGGQKYLIDSEWERKENEEKYLTRCKESHNSYCCFCEKVPVLIPKSTTKTEGKKEQ
jgi:hypothetical protein